MNPAPFVAPLSKMPHLDYVALNARLWDAGRSDLQRRLTAVYRDQVTDEALPADITAAMHPRPAMDPRPDDEITRERSRDAMRRDEPTHQTDQRCDRLPLAEAIKRIGH